MVPTMSAPYIPLYIDDYDAATAHLSAEEDGVYGRLLRLCWRTPGCSIPNDPAWVARKLRISEADYQRVATLVLTEFFTVKNGRLIQKRLKEEFDSIARKQTARKNAGKLGGEAKSRKTKAIVSSNATVLPAHTRAFPEPYPEPEPKEESSLRSESVVSLFGDSLEQETVAGDPLWPRFNEAWKAFPAPGRKRSSHTEAFPLWRAGVKKLKGDHQRLLEAIRRYAKSENENDGGKYTKGFHLWLKASRWEPFLDDDPDDKPVRRLGKDDWQ